jgi:hypothetical protein
MSAPWPTLSVAPNVDRQPWNWNPVETFLTAYTTVQENQRAQEKAAVDAELSRILLPAKAAEAEYNLKKFTLDAQLLEKLHRTKSASLDATYRGINSAVGGGASGTTAGQANNPTGGVYQSKFGFGRSITPASAATGTTAAPRVIGSGVQPKGT